MNFQDLPDKLQSLGCLVSSAQAHLNRGAFHGLKLDDTGQWVLDPLSFLCCQGTGVCWGGTTRISPPVKVSKLTVTEKAEAFLCPLGRRLREFRRLAVQFAATWHRHLQPSDLALWTSLVPETWLQWLPVPTTQATRGWAFDGEGADQPSMLVWLLALWCTWHHDFECHVVTLRARAATPDSARGAVPLLPPEDFGSNLQGLMFIEQKIGFWDSQALDEFHALTNLCHSGLVPMWLGVLLLPPHIDEAAQEWDALAAIRNKLQGQLSSPLAWVSKERQGPGAWKDKLQEVCRIATELF